MNIFNLRNNALFLRGFRERTRFSAVASAVALSSILVVLIVLSAVLNDNYVYDYKYIAGEYQSQKVLLPWFKKVVLDLSKVQAIVLFFFGSLNAYRIAARERMVQTIDFHRSSPSPRWNQIVGLVLGSTCLEWFVFTGLALVLLAISLISDISTAVIAQFHVQLIFCGFLYHALFALIGISRDPLKGKAGPILIFVGLYFFSHLLFANQLSFMHQFTWLNAFHELDTHVKNHISEYYGGHHRKQLLGLMNTFFSLKLHPLFIQLLVQIPFIALLLEGIGRRFENLEQPIFSKTQTLMTTFYLLLLYAGSFTSIFLSGLLQHTHRSMDLGILFVLIWILFAAGAILATPSRLDYTRGLRRAAKLKRRGIRPEENAAGNSRWLGVFVLIVVIGLSYFAWLLRVPSLNFILALMILCSYFDFCASFFEYFRLSRHHTKLSLAATILIILWIVLPVLGMILESIIPKPSTVMMAFMAPSPFFGGTPVVMDLFKTGKPYLQTTHVVIVLVISGTLAAVTNYLAYQERQKLKRDNLNIG